MVKKPKDVLKFWDELKRRKVVKASLVYLAVAFGILQASDIIFPRLGLPEWTVTFVIILLLIVFILVVVLTWVYDITPEGIKVTREIEAGQKVESPDMETDHQVAHDQKLAKESGSEETDLMKKVHDLEEQLEKTKKYTNKTLLLIGIKKLALPVIIVAVILLLLINKQRITDALGIRNAKKEAAKSHNESAASYINAGDYKSAKREADLALESDPGYSYAWANMAVISYRLGDRAKAILETTKAISLDPRNSYAPFNIAFALQDKKDYDQAIRWYKEAIRIDSTYNRDTVFTAACSALGNLYNSINRPIDAVIIISRAMAQYPGSKYEYLLHRNLGNAYLLQAQSDSALRHLQLSNTEKPSEPETNLYLAKAYEAAGDVTKSIEAWKSYIELEQDTLKLNAAKIHLKEITRAYLQELAK